MSDIQGKYKINQGHKRIVRHLIESLIINSDPELKPTFEEALKLYDSNTPKALLEIRQGSSGAKALLDEYMIEFFAWEESFEKTVEQFGMKQELGSFNIQDKLILMQNKIKPKNIHNSYIAHLVTVLKRELKLDDKFITKWRDIKNVCKTEKIEMAKNKSNPEQSQQQKQQRKQQPKEVKKQIKEQPKQLPRPERSQVKIPAPIIPDVVPAGNVTIPSSMLIKEQGQRKIVEKTTERNKIKATYEAKSRKNKQIRHNNLMKYLDSRKDLVFPNKEGVAKQLLNNLERFMKQKIEKILEKAKIRHPGYESEDAGDQFRVFSSKSNLIDIKHTAMIPESDIKILKVRYPSKLEQYLKLRVSEEKLEQKIKNQMKSRLESDKKSERMIQNYMLADQRETAHRFEKDQGPKKKEKLIIVPQVIQYTIENDPWFGELYLMERTFYKSSL